MFYLAWIVAGVLATVVMDIGATLVKLTGLTAGTPPLLIAKWMWGTLEGRFTVDDIRTVTGPAVTVAHALPFHYSIGAFLGLMFGLLVRALALSPVPFWVALVYGVCTTVFAAFLMFPSMGFGVLGLKGPPEFLLLRTALVNHAIYGLGLWLTARFVATRIGG
jgi:hypothetical protein